jgi:hypothetical protein
MSAFNEYFTMAVLLSLKITGSKPFLVLQKQEPRRLAPGLLRKLAVEELSHAEPQPITSTSTRSASG